MEIDHKITAQQPVCSTAYREELQFERLTRELEAERQIVANQLERCRLGAESPGAASGSSSEKSLPWRSTDVSTSADAKSRMTDGSQSPPFRVRTEAEQLSLCSPEQSSLHESEGSVGNSRSSTQMNSYSDSGYQDAGSYYSNQNAGKMEVRLQHSYPGTSAATCGTLLRNSRAEGQTSGQMVGSVSGAIPGRAMRRVSSVPSRTQSPAYGSSISPSRGSLRASPGSAYGSPIVTEPKPLSSIFSSTTLPSAQRAGSPFSTQKSSPAALRRMGSANSRSGSVSRTTSPYSGRVGSPLSVAGGADGQGGSGSSPVRSGMTAVPQHYGLTLPRTLMHEGSDPYSTHSYEIYERMVPRPDSLTDGLAEDLPAGLRASYASQHSHHGPELRSAMSPDRHIGPIYEDRAFQGPLYRSPSHVTHSTLYRSPSGVGNLQRSSSQRSNLTYQRSSYMLNAAAPYSEPYRPGPYRPSEGYTRPTVGMDDGATRSPSIDSIQKDPREFAWRDPELPEVIHMLQHQFPSVQANAAAYLQHLCFGDNGTKAEVCRLGGIKHLVDLLDHKVLEVQRNACGALRNLVYGKATDDNKIAVRNAGGVPALLRLLRKTVDAEVREIVTGSKVLFQHGGTQRPCWYRAFTFVLTFLLYTSFHLSRKPISIVKSELHKNCTQSKELATVSSKSSQEHVLHVGEDCSWKPFDKENYKQLLGAMDLSFLFVYAVGMYLSGIIGERLPIRLYLTMGMLTSGLFTCLFGLGYAFNVHSLSFYIFVQIANGLVQTTGWPSVVTCIGNWFGKGRRGLIMGLWNSHTSVGNILGSLIAGYYVSWNWGLSFVVPGIIIAVMGIICFLFLIEHPNDLKNAGTQNGAINGQKLHKSWMGINGHKELYLQYKQGAKSQSTDTELLLSQDREVCVPVQQVVVVKSEAEPSAISFRGALCIPGVVEFSFCLLFAKLVSYTFLFWLPLYITKAAQLDSKEAGDLSTLFDVGGIVGGILAGVVSDKLGKRATTCAVMLLLAAPTLYGFSMISQFGQGPTIGMLLVCGGLVNGPYALITTAVSADLGTHKSLKGNARALSTVTAIIDGTGSVGAAIGPPAGRTAFRTELGSGLLYAHGGRLFGSAVAAEIGVEGAEV
ncbi:hypothetical protein SRHO_G00106140 [Serrasalmus rhombeus]